ncbi:MAG TPA: hypothetical protein VIS49_02900 [Cyclobacteriaceae bacterium]
MQTTKKISIGLLLALFSVFSCTEDVGPTLTEDDSVSVENEAVADSYFEDADDITALVVSSDNGTVEGGKVSAGGRIINLSDFRLNCAQVTIEFADNSTILQPKGTITIDFGDGCTDDRGNVRTGKIIITFIGRRFLPQSSIVTTFDGYTINEVLVEGTRTVTNSSGSLEDHPSFTIVVEGGKLTWPDGTTATRDSNRRREWIRAANPLNDEWRVTGNAAGTNRREISYTMEITEALVYKRQCAISNRIFMPVAGEKVLTTETRQMKINYGDGECDRMVKVTINGKSEDIEIKG